MTKPRIIVLSKDDDTEGFKWLSDGWNESSIAHTIEAKELMAKARQCVMEGVNVLGVIAKLKDAGFEVSRSH